MKFDFQLRKRVLQTYRRLQNTEAIAERKLSASGKQVMCFFRRLCAGIVVHKEEAGYYIVLTLVLIALGAAANDYRDKKSLQRLIAIQPTPEAGISVQTKPDQTLPPEEKNQKYVQPVQGNIIGKFSDNELVWSTTLQLWQTHPAIDIAAAAGTAIVAAADGTIIEVYNDALYGNIIVIEHDDGSQLRYCSLNTLQLVKTGQPVYQGDIISAVGTCDAEAELGAHLHLEYLVNKTHADFEQLLLSDALQN